MFQSRICQKLYTGPTGPGGSHNTGQIEQLIGQFNLGSQMIRAASQEALTLLAHDREMDIGLVVWDACRAQARPRLDELAQRIEPVGTWDDLVLPEAQR